MSDLTDRLRKTLKGSGQDKDLYAIFFKYPDRISVIDEYWLFSPLHEFAILQIAGYIAERGYEIENIEEYSFFNDEEDKSIESTKDFIIVGGKLYSQHLPKDAYTFEKMIDGYIMTVKRPQPEAKYAQV
jgi:hypothetical protein